MNSILVRDYHTCAYIKICISIRNYCIMGCVSWTARYALQGFYFQRVKVAHVCTHKNRGETGESTLILIKSGLKAVHFTSRHSALFSLFYQFNTQNKWLRLLQFKWNFRGTPGRKLTYPIYSVNNKLCVCMCIFYTFSYRGRIIIL